MTKDAPAPTHLLPLKTKLLYGLGDVGNAITTPAAIFFLLFFYTDVVLVPAVLAANALLIGKIWDAINDPLFGWISDRTHSRMGRRRVYMVWGAIPFGISIGLLWFVPSSLSITGIFLWITFTYILFDSLMTLTSVPYYALTAELTPDYNERSSLTAFRMLIGVPAYIIGGGPDPSNSQFF